MGLLIKEDYFRLIREDVLDVVIDEDENFLTLTEDAVTVEMVSYLNGRFDTAQLFTTTNNYTIAVAATVGDFFHLSAAAYTAATVYNVGDLVSHTDGNVYKCIQITTGTEDPTNAAFFELWGVEGGFYTALVAGAGLKPADPVSFSAGDTRNPLILRYLVDLTVYELHSRINPRNIPDLRVTRRDDALNWLQQVANPRNDMSPDFPLKTFEDKQDNVLIWGSNDKLTHSY